MTTDVNDDYLPSPAQQIADVKTAAWLLEAIVSSMPGSSVDFDGLIKSPSLFPFQICRLHPEQLAESGRLEVVRHGLQDVLLRLRETSTAARLDGLAGEASDAGVYSTGKQEGGARASKYIKC